MIFLLISFLFHILICNNFINITDSNIYPKINNNDIIYNSLNHSEINRKKNLILGTLIRYSWDNILIFFNSLIEANFSNCDVVIFTKDVNYRVRNYLKNIGVILFHIPDKYNYTDITKSRWKL